MLGKKLIEQLSPLLEGGGPDDRGEWAMHCPYHGDSRRSASVNVENELWYCHGCGESGEARDLIVDKENWQIPDDMVSYSGGSYTQKPRNNVEVSEAKVEGWHSALMSSPDALDALLERRGITVETVENYQIGYDLNRSIYTIPIRDLQGEICNVRFYDMYCGPDRRKIWSVDGMGSPTLFPVDQLSKGALVICEGEWDALLSIQSGVPAITRTGGADHWKADWSPLFNGKKVFLCHDMDTKGQKANEVMSAALKRNAASITVVSLPYEVTEKHGKDITDFYMEGYERSDFLQLIMEGDQVSSISEKQERTEPTIVPVTVMDSFDGSLVDEPLKMQVTVTGKKIPSYLVPKKVFFYCDMLAGKKCDYCSLRSAGGELRSSVGAESALVLGMLNVSEDKLKNTLRESHEIVKCNRVKIEIEEHRTVEEIYVRPSIEKEHNAMGQDFTHRKVISTSSHDLSSNQTVDIVGTIRPNPNNQANEFQAWSVSKPVSALDIFELTAETRESMEVFRDYGDDPLTVLEDVAEDISSHVTRIYHRPEMHQFIDLVFHSGLRFTMGHEVVEKGWLDAIIIGDTRTGKSEASLRMLEEYGMGEMVSCESATYAGVVGGLDRTADNRWIVKWGSIPVNDRRIVVLDEVSGLSAEQIAQMSSIRSSGIAEMTKIQNERALARTRLLWLANPRDSRMDDYTFGVQALPPLIGNNEDVARFDMAMGAFSREVSASLINSGGRQTEERRYETDSLRNCLRWAWTRRTEDIVITDDAVRSALAEAKRIGGRYSESPPLVQGANARMKIARIAVAIAMRTFSCDDAGKCVVEPRHVEAATAFLDKIYGNVDFGYSVISDQINSDRNQTIDNMDRIMQYIVARPGLSRFLKHTPVFDRNALETVMNLGREMSGAMVNEMWDMKAVIYEDGKVKLAPEVLKEIRTMTNE